MDAEAHTVRPAREHLLTVARFAPGFVGAGLVTVGAGLIWEPLSFITLGAFLLLIDRRLG